MNRDQGQVPEAAVILAIVDAVTAELEVAEAQFAFVVVRTRDALPVSARRKIQHGSNEAFEGIKGRGAHVDILFRTAPRLAQAYSVSAQGADHEDEVAAERELAQEATNDALNSTRVLELVMLRRLRITTESGLWRSAVLDSQPIRICRSVHFPFPVGALRDSGVDVRYSDDSLQFRSTNESVSASLQGGVLLDRHWTKGPASGGLQVSQVEGSEPPATSTLNYSLVAGASWVPGKQAQRELLKRAAGALALMSNDGDVELLSHLPPKGVNFVVEWGPKRDVVEIPTWCAYARGSTAAGERFWKFYFCLNEIDATSLTQALTQAERYAVAFGEAVLRTQHRRLSYDSAGASTVYTVGQNRSTPSPDPDFEMFAVVADCQWVAPLEPDRGSITDLRTIAKALDGGHKAGIVYADVKPANTYRAQLTAGGKVSMGLFDIDAVSLADTRLGLVRRTPFYSIPALRHLDSAQAARSSSRALILNDQFGFLALVLHQLVGGDQVDVAMTGDELEGDHVSPALLAEVKRTRDLYRDITSLEPTSETEGMGTCDSWLTTLVSLSESSVPEKERRSLEERDVARLRIRLQPLNVNQYSIGFNNYCRDLIDAAFHRGVLVARILMAVATVVALFLILRGV